MMSVSPVANIVSTKRDRLSAQGNSPYSCQCLPEGGIAPVSGIATGCSALPSYRLYSQLAQNRESRELTRLQSQRVVIVPLV
jgi:hypothetical protein